MEKNPTGYSTRVVQPQSRDPTPATILTARRCKYCNSDRVASYGGSHRNSGGARVLYCVCKNCGAKNTYVMM